jgi:Fe-S cluster biogenesis protein NfuA
VPEVALGVAFSGVGRITSDLPGVDCAATCTTEWDQGAIVTLNAEPAATDRFVHWSGSCKGAGPCSLTLAAPAAATAVFGPLRIPLRLSTAGKGKIKCTPACGKTFPGGDSLTLRAVPTKGFKFVRWSGGCKGTRPACRPPTDFAVTVHASFKRR